MEAFVSSNLVSVFISGSMLVGFVFGYLRKRPVIAATLSLVFGFVGYLALYRMGYVNLVAHPIIYALGGLSISIATGIVAYGAQRNLKGIR